MIRDATIEDAAAICDIYNHYVANTIITFEEKPVSVKDMQDRIEEVISSFPWYVWHEDDRVIGYSYASKWKGRTAYRFTVEGTVYLHSDFIGKGIGAQLYTAVISELRERSHHSIIGGIALPNAASVALHEKLGFTKVAHFKELGWKLGRWIDVGYWELLLQNTQPPLPFLPAR
jgi:L-amino acid N-acyltransferase YncA